MSDAVRAGAPPRDVLGALRVIAERSPTALLVTEGPTYLVRYANPALRDLLAFEGAPSPVGRPLVDSLPELADEAHRAVLDLVYRTGEAHRTPEFERVDHRLGTRVRTLCIWPAREDEGGGPRHLLVEVRDVTTQASEIQRGHLLAEETRRINERLVVAGVRMQELADEAETARRRLEILAEAGGLLSASFDTSTMLPAVARLLVPRLGDVCAIDLFGGPGVVSRTVVEPEGISQEMERALASARIQALALGGLLVRTIHDADQCVVAHELRDLGFVFALAIPMRSRKRVQGVLTVLSRRDLLDPADVTLAVEIAHRIAITLDQVDLYQKAVGAARAREELLAAVSHDLRSPLHTILFSVALLEKGAISSSPSEARHLERIQRTAEYMQHLLRDLVDSAKMEAHRFLVDREPCAIAPLVGEVVEMMLPLAARKSIRLETDLSAAAASAVIWMDRARMAQVLTNLIGNAVKFTPERGSILVRAELRPDHVLLSVHDTGPGIPKEDLGRLFDRYWQARQTAHLGAGLGLFIAKGIVLAHGGTIWAESELGASTTFYVAVPTSPPLEPEEDADGAPAD